MATRSLRWLVGALLVALALAACSSDDEPSSDTASSPSESSPTNGSETPTTGDVCAELSAVKSAAATIRSDLQARQLAAAATDISTLQSAIDDLVQAMSSSAQGDVDDVTSAWSDVKSTVANLDKSNLGQVRSMLQESVGELRTALENVGSDLSCS